MQTRCKWIYTKSQQLVGFDLSKLFLGRKRSKTLKRPKFTIL